MTKIKRITTLHQECRKSLSTVVVALDNLHIAVRHLRYRKQVDEQTAAMTYEKIDAMLKAVRSLSIWLTPSTL